MREFTVLHQWEEHQNACVECGATDISKLFNNSFTTKKEQKKETKVGNLTREYIETNREVLKELQEEAKKETHE
tara:strand:- start:1740 stop:1961 length:222 start_codon:yes stop_codon:yes gene_type:complete